LSRSPSRTPDEKIAGEVLAVPPNAGIALRDEPPVKLKIKRIEPFEVFKLP
jgi:hypothetical protein